MVFTSVSPGKTMSNSKEHRAFALGPSLDQLDVLRHEVEAFGQDLDLNPAVVFELNLALDELVTNVLTHGQEHGGVAGVHVALNCGAEGLEIVISDDGAPFDPNQAPTPDTACDLDSRCVGGLGIHLAKSLMDELEYKYEDGRNVTTLRKNHNPRCG